MVVLTGASVDKVWLNKSRYSEAEKKYYEQLAKPQKEGTEETVDSGVQSKGDASPKKKRKRNSNKDEAAGAKGSPAGSRLPIGAKEVVAAAPIKDKKNNKDKKNSKNEKDRKNSESNNRSPVDKTKKQEVKEPEKEISDDITWDMIDSQPTTQPEPTQAPLPVVQSIPDLMDTTVPTPNVQSSQKPAVEDKRSKDKKKNKKSQWKQEKIDDIALMTTNNANLDHGNRITQLERDNKDLKAQVEDLLTVIKKLEIRITSLEKGSHTAAPKSSAPKPAPAPAADDDDVDLFGSDSEEEDEAAKKVKEQRLAEYAAKKSKKPVLIAKSNIILDVKPWDDETDMKQMEVNVRNIAMDGLIWGASKLVPLAYGIHKLQISCVVEDDKVSVDLLTETIEAIEDFVQSVDIAAFNKV